MDMLQKINEAAEFIKSKFSKQPKVAIVLGTGLGGLVNEIDIEQSIPYEQIPNFPVSTVEGHQGRLIIGTISGVPVLAMQGRFHYYEGYEMWQVTMPTRVFKKCGIETLFVSNAAGGLNKDFPTGTVMIINDHINHFGTNPLIGKNLEEFGPRFPDMSEPYSKRLIKKAFEIAAEEGIKVEQGVYLGTSGPTFETMAECRMFRTLGADAVGMSTVPEVIVAKHCGMEVFGVSVITNNSMVEVGVESSHEDVQKAAGSAEPKMTKIIKRLVASL